MNKILRIHLWIFLFAGVFLTGCGLSLAADVTPPPNAQTIEQQPAAIETVFPLVPPDPDNGAKIYAEKCAPCHGDTGKGDGPQAAQLSVPVAPIGDAALANTRRPVDWYNIVTNGNLERFMPGFRSLSDRERWDVVAYAYVLSQSDADLTLGQSVYTANCAGCHGDLGEGNGITPNWVADSSKLAQLSADEIVAVIQNGLDDQMPAYNGKLSQDDVWAVTAYIRSLSFASLNSSESVQKTPLSEQQPEETVVAARPGMVKILGKLNLPAEMTLPNDLLVNLQAFDGMALSEEKSATVESDGTFEFSDVEIKEGRIFLASLEYEGIVYNSDAVHAADVLGDTVNIEIPIYATTTDKSGLKADRMHVFLDFTNPEVVQVVELFIMSNSSDKIIVANNPGEPVLQYTLPEGATNLQFQDGVLGDQYVETETGFGDTRQLYPGEGFQILFAYDLPYQRKMKIDITVPVQVDAAVVMMPTNGVKLESDQLQYMGQREVQGFNLNLYSASSLAPDSTINFNLSGKPKNGAQVTAGDTTTLIIGSIAMVAVLLAVGYYFFVKRRKTVPVPSVEPAAAEETADDIMDAIIALDELYRKGELPEEAYQQRRAELKDRLRNVM